MIYCKLMGGLGNQLFQIFATISYAIDTNNEFNFIYSDLGNRKSYWNSFFKSLSPYLIYNEPIINIRYEEPSFNYKILNKNIDNNQNILLYGYYQTEKYFKNNFKKICELIDLKNTIEKIKTNRLSLLLDNFNNTVSLHFRLGDYKSLQGFHPIIPIEYYIKSISKIIEITSRNDIRILYFFENNTEDVILVKQNIALLKHHFNELEFIECPNNINDYEVLLIMSLCEHNIIVNSSFSWWGAYLNNNENKIVTYPSLWFGVNLKQHDTSDLFPDKWNKINI